MHSASRRRLETRYTPAELLPATVLLKTVRGARMRGVPGLLVDASKAGMGILVQEHVALESQCIVEFGAGDKIQQFMGEVCYATRTSSGLKLGILFTEDNTKPVLEYLEELNIGVTESPPLTGP